LIAIGPAVATLMLSICSTSVRLLGVIPERNKANGKSRLFFDALSLDASSILISLFDSDLLVFLSTRGSLGISGDIVLAVQDIFVSTLQS